MRCFIKFVSIYQRVGLEEFFPCVFFVSWIQTRLRNEADQEDWSSKAFREKITAKKKSKEFPLVVDLLKGSSSTFSYSIPVLCIFNFFKEKFSKKKIVTWLEEHIESPLLYLDTMWKHHASERDGMLWNLSRSEKPVSSGIVRSSLRHKINNKLELRCDVRDVMAWTRRRVAIGARERMFFKGMNWTRWRCPHVVVNVCCVVQGK